MSTEPSFEAPKFLSVLGTRLEYAIATIDPKDVGGLLQRMASIEPQQALSAAANGLDRIAVRQITIDDAKRSALKLVQNALFQSALDIADEHAFGLEVPAMARVSRQAETSGTPDVLDRFAAVGLLRRNFATNQMQKL